MKAKKMTSEQLAKTLFDMKEKLPTVEFFLNKSGDDCEYGCKVAVIAFADTVMVIGNYFGGGSPFVYDFDDDKDESGLSCVIGSWLNQLSSDTEDGVPVVYVDFIVPSDVV